MFEKQRRNSCNYALLLKKLQNKHRKLSNIASFGAGRPLREIKEWNEYDTDGYYQTKDGSSVHRDNIFNVKDNPNHEFLVCPNWGFEIVSDGKTPNAKWSCKHESCNCHDIDCTVPNLG